MTKINGVFLSYQLLTNKTLIFEEINFYCWFLVDNICLCPETGHFST